MNDRERLRKMYEAKLRGDEATFDRLYQEERDARYRADMRARGERPMHYMGRLVKGADGVYRPEAAR